MALTIKDHELYQKNLVMLKSLMKPLSANLEGSKAKKLNLEEMLRINEENTNKQLNLIKEFSYQKKVNGRALIGYGIVLNMFLPILGIAPTVAIYLRNKEKLRLIQQSINEIAPLTAIEIKRIELKIKESSLEIESFEAELSILKAKEDALTKSMMDKM